MTADIQMWDVRVEVRRNGNHGVVIAEQAVTGLLSDWIYCYHSCLSLDERLQWVTLIYTSLHSLILL